MRDVCKKTAKIVLEDEAGDLAAILDEYIKSMQTGMHKGRRLDKAAAKSYATAFAERADAVNQMADHVSAAIRTPSAVGRHETPTPPASPDVQALVEAAKRSLQGWLNVEELRLLPDRHRGTGIELAASLHRALASFTGAKP
jgi:hypothetical protein